MNIDLLLALVFYVLLYLYIRSHKEKFQIQGKIAALYKTQIGLKAMDGIAKKFPRTLRVLSYVSIISGFAGMAAIFYVLVKGTFTLVAVKGAAPAVAPIIPGVKIIPGLPVLSFWHCIIAILVVAIVHEFTHGVFGRLYKTPIKSSGFLIFGPILGAFVEPDEKYLKKQSKKVQLAVFSGGPFANMIATIILGVLLIFALNPLQGKLHAQDGIIVHDVMESYPAASLRDQLPFRIVTLNDASVPSIERFLAAMGNTTPGQTVSMGTDKGTFILKTVSNPNNQSASFLGIAGLEIVTKVRPEIEQRFGKPLISLFKWFHLLIFWMVVVNLGVGLFNLLPLGPLDGGRMFLAAASALWEEKKAKKVWGFVSYFCLLLIFINLAPFLWKFLLFLAKPLLLFVGV